MCVRVVPVTKPSHLNEPASTLHTKAKTVLRHLHAGCPDEPLPGPAECQVARGPDGAGRPENCLDRGRILPPTHTHSCSFVAMPTCYSNPKCGQPTILGQCCTSYKFIHKITYPTPTTCQKLFYEDRDKSPYAFIELTVGGCS